MDPGIIAVFIPIVTVFMGGLFLLARTDIGKAIAQRISGGAGSNDDIHARLSEVEGELAGLRQELGETQERLDFAERLLSKGREGDDPGGAQVNRERAT